MNVENFVGFLRTKAAFTVTAGNKPGWNVDDKTQMIMAGPQETLALAQVGVTLPARAELVAAALAKRAQAITPTGPTTPAPQGLTPMRRWFWFGGGILAGVLLTFLVLRSRPTA